MFPQSWGVDPRYEHKHLKICLTEIHPYGSNSTRHRPHRWKTLHRKFTPPPVEMKDPKLPRIIQYLSYMGQMLVNNAPLPQLPTNAGESSRILPVNLVTNFYSESSFSRSELGDLKNSSRSSHRSFQAFQQKYGFCFKDEPTCTKHCKSMNQSPLF